MYPTFTLAESRDADLLVELMRESYAFEHMTFDEAVARHSLQQITSNRFYGLVYLISVEGKVAGYVVLTFGFSLEFHGRDALIDELYLREGYRGKGFGKASLEHIDEVCKREGVRRYTC